jgi:hypothetical protein
MPGVRSGLVCVEERDLVRGSGIPAGAVEQPATLGQRTVLVLPGADVLDLQQEVGVGGGLLAAVEHGRWTDQIPRRYLRDIVEILAGDPVIGASKWVPTCSPALKLFQYQAGPRSS